MIASGADVLSAFIAAGIVLAVIGYMAACRPAIFIALFFVLLPFAQRLLSTLYIDLAGPVFSQQTERWIGAGLATPIHALAYMLTLMPFFWFFQPKHIAAWVHGADTGATPQGAVTVSDITYTNRM